MGGERLIACTRRGWRSSPRAGVTARVGSAVDGSSVRLWVEDDGPGVAPDQAPRIFDRFVKGAHRPEGSGLGLSIVAAIADAHGGRARLAPTSGRGARFEIVLPLTRPAPPPRPPASTETALASTSA